MSCLLDYLGVFLVRSTAFLFNSECVEWITALASFFLDVDVCSFPKHTWMRPSLYSTWANSIFQV